MAFHCGVIAACSVALKMITSIGKWRRGQSALPESDIRREFRQAESLLSYGVHPLILGPSSYSLIPLTLFYSSFTKLFLLFLLTIWRPSRLEPLDPVVTWNTPKLSDFLDILDNSQVDREWIVRNVLGGMSAGFGLRGKFSPSAFYGSLLTCGTSYPRLPSRVYDACYPLWMGREDRDGGHG